MKRRMALYILLALTVLLLADGKYGLSNSLAPYRHLVTFEGIEGEGLEESGNLRGVLGPGEVLKIRNSFGHVDILGTPETTEAQLDYSIYVYATSESQGAAYLDELRVTAVRTPDGLDVCLVEPGERPKDIRQVRVDISGSIPSGARVEVSNNGRAHIRGVSGPSVVNNAFSDTTIEDIQGDLHVDAAFTDLLVTGIRGELMVEGDYGASSISNIDGNVLVKSDYRLTSLSSVSGDVEADSSYGGIKVNQVDGSFKARGSFSVIGGNHIAGSAVVNTEYGTVHLEAVRRDMIVDARRSNVTIVLDQVPNHRIYLETENGDLTLGGSLSDLQPISGEAGKKMVSTVVGAGTHSIEVRNTQGSIEISQPHYH